MSAVENYELKEKHYADPDVQILEANDGLHAGPRLKRELKPRHIAMISIGGVIGTGLFLGTGGALHNGGPLGLWFGYSLMGSICFSVMIGLGEMISYLPVEGGHITLANRFVDPAWSFALSFNYLYNWLIILPAELSAVAVLVGYWDASHKYSNALWISIALVVVVAINLFGARGYGEAEFVFASIKVLTIIVLIFVGIAINCGAGPTSNGYIGFSYWKEGAFNSSYQKLAPPGLARFLGFWAVLTQAAFSFIGTEIVAIASGEAKNPRRNLPKAIKTVYVRILVFYILGTFIISIICRANDPLIGTAHNATASPWVIAISRAGIKGLPALINACLITSAWSAGSSDLYTSSRAIYGIAINGDLPKFFARTTKGGLPYVGVAISTLFGCLAYMGLGDGAGKVFNWLANMTAIAGLFSWLAISVTYIRFRAGMDAQGIDRATLPYSNRLSKVAAYWAVSWIVVIMFFSGWTVFLPGQWSVADFVTNYLPVAVFPVLFCAKKFISKTTWRSAESMDFYTGLQEIIDEEEPYVPPTTWYGKLGEKLF